ncbi:nucleoside-diphosphate-sugar epimerase [Streptomyces sp. 846.5]|nr:NAD-dependent epimerase/dehydratase family protein [Streptomyces sp. 846.5]TDU02210.1 nucleoside-diphosphate-sugar epimerase [Streptomyces sp. 846.5]
MTGATGFVGSAVVRELVARQDRATAGAAAGSSGHRFLARRVPAGRPAGVGEWRTADLDDPTTLRGCCDGIDTVLHLASRIGGDPEQCRRTNLLGTEALLAEAHRAGVRRVVLLSTAAVYGDGPHRGCREGELTPAPVSATSRSRLAAERVVLAHGGTVVRPHLIHGPGDRWVLPGIADLVRKAPAWPAGGRARVSLVAVEDLARALLALALDGGHPHLAGRVLHAVHPEPVSVRELIGAVCGLLELPLPGTELDRDRLTRRLVAAGADPADRRPALLTVDRWYDGDALWRCTGVEPGPGFAHRLGEHSGWYRAALGVGARSV